MALQLNKRFRRLRTSVAVRNMVAETSLTAAHLMAPLFILEGEKKKEEIASMPGYFRFSLDLLEAEILELKSLGIRSVLIFVKVPDHLKDNEGKEALNPNGLMQRTVKFIKKVDPDMVVMTDVALDPYSTYGHDGIVLGQEIVNDPTVEVLAAMSLSHAQAGADFVAPSDMMDGRVKAIREKLDEAGFQNVGILSYGAKYASSFYGPFRDALDSAPGFGDKKTYQMDFRNSREALKEVDQDIEEGADIVMVKPAGAYLDIIRIVKDHVTVPVAAYQISGEYAMIKAAAANGWIDEKQAMIESLMAIRRAGADVIATYFAKDYARSLK
jgi:porphobilinogen synthase